MGTAWWSWSNAGWLFRSRGHGSISRSRNLVAGKGAMRIFRVASRIALPSLCVTQNRACSDDGICALCHIEKSWLMSTGVPFPRPIRRFPVQWNAEGA
jgi:hypothetical protein